MQAPRSLGRFAYRTNKYREAMTKTEQCKVPKDGKTSRYEEWLTKEYNEYCLKSKSANIIMCPQKIINQPSNILQGVKKYLTNLGKKSKKTKKKGKEKRNKKKKKSKKSKKTNKKGKDKRNKKKKKSKKNKARKKRKQ